MNKGTVLAIALALAAVAGGCGDGEDEPQASGPIAPVETAISPMPPSGFAVEWGIPGVPSTVKPGAQFGAGVPVKNIGDQVWLDPAHAESRLWASGAVRLVYRWWSADGKKAVTTYETSTRGDLAKPLKPSGSAALAVLVTAPAEPGRYQLQFELVQENVSWFEDKGAAKLMVPVTVAEDAAGAKGQP